MKPFMLAAWATAAVLCACAATTRASVVVGGTRVVFPAQRGEASVRLTNENNHAALVEAWIDTGDINSTPNSVTTPFLLTPPLFRMDPQKDQTLRIIYTQVSQPLPADRESLFWLNVLEIPPKPTGQQAAGQNYLQFAIRSRLKLFYRPANLPGNAMKAPEKLNFTAQGTTLVVHNPTPYYVTISKLSLGHDNTSIDGASGMVAPLGDLRLPLNGYAQAPSAGTPVAFTAIDDYGAANVHKGTITP